MHADDKQLEEATIPNWCNNTVKFTHADTTQIARVATAFAAEQLMQEFYPCPTSLNITAGMDGPKGSPEQLALEAQEQKNIQEHGFANWYDWQVEMWGTKWDVGDKNNDCGYVVGDTAIVLSFDSAWSPPIGFYEKMEELGFSVDAMYYEPGMAFCGHYVDGEDAQYEITGNAEWVDNNIPEDINMMFAIAENMADWEDTE